MSVTDEWQKELREEGYKHTISSVNDIRKIRRYSRMWRRILKYIDLPSASISSILEVGCGGGKHIASFALNNFHCTGIDCSKEVLDRAKLYMDSLEKQSNTSLKVDLICSDFEKFETDNIFDIVYHVGVLEHYTNNDLRMILLKKMLNMIKPGGHFLHIVPNGSHPARNKMRSSGLGGYKIPEIDYSCSLLYSELEQAGFTNINILPHNLFNYILFTPSHLALKIFKQVYYLLWQTVPISLLPSKFSCVKAGTLIGIGRKPCLKL